MTTTYVNDAARDGELLLDLLGSYWSASFEGRDLLESYAGGVGQLDLQTFMNAMELVDSLAVADVPVYHQENWYPLVLRLSERQEAGVLAYGDGAVYGPQADGYVYAYGLSRDGAAAFPTPTALRRAPVLCNNLARPTIVWTAGIDFNVADGLIAFREDPFEDALVPKRHTYTADGEVADTEVVLWLFRADFDLGYAYEQFGYALGLRLASSEAYRDLLATLFGVLAGGPTELALRTALSLMCGAPLARVTGEEVEDIASLPSGLLIVTSAGAYRFGPGALPVVAVGDVLSAGDVLVNAFSVTSLAAGVLPATVASLSAGRGLLVGDYAGDLTFRNQELPVTVTTDADGYTVLTFPVDGDPADVARFWDEVHARGLAAGQTLAQLLDTRTNKVGEPPASALPATVNPLQFLAENLLRNVLLVELDASAAGPDAVGIQPTVLRRLVPPQYAALLLVDLTAAADAAVVNAAGTATTTGTSEGFAYFTAAETLAETVTTGDVTETAVNMSVVAD